MENNNYNKLVNNNKNINQLLIQNINNLKNSTNNTKSKDTNAVFKQEKTSTIQVSIRVRPLLEHEDVDFWKPDFETNSLTTVK